MKLSNVGSVAIGIFVGLLSTGIQSIGLTLQRKSHLLEDEKEDEHIRRPPYRRRRWQLGMLMFIVSNLVGSTIQITTLPLPVLSTLQASGLVFNTICATLVLGEPFTKWSLGGTVLVAAGAVLIASYGAMSEPSHSLAQLLVLLGRRQFILWMVGTGIIIAAVLAFALLIQRMHPENTPRSRLYQGMSFGAISGILSAHSLLVAKSAVELLVRTIVDGKNQFRKWQSWVILIMLVFFALSQLYFLHRGLKLCSTSVLYPFVFCIYNIIAIMDGLIYFQQTDRLPPLHAGLIAVGTLILLGGVLALSWRLDDMEHAPATDVHTLLTPGMGIVEDTTTEDGDTGSTTPLNSSDEEEGPPRKASEHTPLLSNNYKSPHRLRKTPTDKLNNVLEVTKHRRRFAAATNEADAIWDELEDNDTWTKSPRRPVSKAMTLPLSRSNRDLDVRGSVTSNIRAFEDDSEADTEAEASSGFSRVGTESNARRQRAHTVTAPATSNRDSEREWRRRRRKYAGRRWSLPAAAQSGTAASSAEDAVSNHAPVVGFIDKWLKPWNWPKQR